MKLRIDEQLIWKFNTTNLYISKHHAPSLILAVVYAQDLFPVPSDALQVQVLSEAYESTRIKEYSWNIGPFCYPSTWPLIWKNTLTKNVKHTPNNSWNYFWLMNSGFPSSAATTTILLSYPAPALSVSTIPLPWQHRTFTRLVFFILRLYVVYAIEFTC